jgi:hypothetical protein
MIHALVGALLLGAVSTAGDFIWAVYRLRHRAGYGLAHGAIICLCVGVVIGWRAGRPLYGAAVGPVIGVAAAAFFYALMPWLWYYGMFPAWMFFWILFAFLQARLEQQSYASAARRGLIAAVLSGAAFYMISGIWTRPSPHGPNYPLHFVAWSFAFLPGFLALFVRQRPDGRGRRAV